jgi:hypothetical protein
MPFVLISHMMQEYSSMMNTDDKKDDKACNIQQDMQGIVIGATPFNRNQQEISPV